MGRLLEALRAETQPVATPATFATQGPKSRRVASVAAPLVPKPCADEIALQARCSIACDSLPILPMALYESLSDADKAAQYTGEEGPEILRAYAEAITARLRAAYKAALSGREGAAMFRYRLAWNPETWHALILPPGATLAEARARLKREHGKALVWTEAYKPGIALQAVRA